MVNKTYIVYMAAGNSRRFFEDKLHYVFHGKPLYQYGLDTLKEVIKQREDVEVLIVSNTIKVEEEAIHTIVSPQSKLGISYTIKTAIDYLKTKKDVKQVMFMVSDQPYVKASTLIKMITTLENSNKTICSLKYQDRKGNPVLFDYKYLDELALLQADQGGRKIVKKHVDECCYQEVEDERELFDIDTKQDLQTFDNSC